MGNNINVNFEYEGFSMDLSMSDELIKAITQAGFDSEREISKILWQYFNATLSKSDRPYRYCPKCQTEVQVDKIHEFITEKTDATTLKTSKYACYKGHEFAIATITRNENED